jgi:hypothetical protein
MFVKKKDGHDVHRGETHQAIELGKSCPEICQKYHRIKGGERAFKGMAKNIIIILLPKK